jgi:hypothetical protein
VSTGYGEGLVFRAHAPVLPAADLERMRTITATDKLPKPADAGRTPAFVEHYGTQRRILERQLRPTRHPVERPALALNHTIGRRTSGRMLA